jgi:thiamine phosphate synthase YjbQ (UPF0047 family)
MQALDAETGQRLSVIDITDRVERAPPVDASGPATVFVRHTTAAVTLDEAESRLLGDTEAALGDLALGTWQSVLLVECDGPRTRTVQVSPPAD